MRKNLKSKILLSILAASVFYLPACANAASLTINGDKITASDSVVDDWNIDTSIYYKNSLQNNTITISNKSYNKFQQILGAYAAQIGNTDGSHTNLNDNNVSIENNSFSNMSSIGGAYARFGIDGEQDLNFNSTASLQNNSVTISGSTFNSIITTIRGASADLTNLYLNSEQDKPTVEFTGNKVTIGSGTSFTNTQIYGALTLFYQPVLHINATYYNMSTALTGNSVTINNGAEFKGTTIICGANANLNNSTSDNSSANCMASLTNNSVNINGGTFGDSTDTNNPAIDISGAYINLHNVRDGVYNYGKIASTVTGNSVTISGGTFNAATNVYGAYADLTYQPDESKPIALYYNGTAAITDNTITLTGSAGAYDEDTQARDLKNVNLYGYGYNETAKDVNQITEHSNNNLIVDGWSGTVGSVNNFDAIDFENIKVAVIDDENKTPAASVFYIDATGEDANKNLDKTTVNINSIDTSNYNKGDTVSGTLTLDSEIDTGKINTNISNFSYQDNGDNGLIAETLSGLTVSTDSQTSNHITISATVGDTVLAGKLMDANGTEHTNSNEIDTLTVGGEGFSTNNADIITGVYAAGDQAATGGEVNVAGSYTGKVYAGYSESGAATGNTMTLTSGADVTGADLYGGGSGNASAEVTTGNTLTIDGWSGTVNSLNNFSSIVYEHVSGEMNLNANSVSDKNKMSVVINSVAGGNIAATDGNTTATIAAIKLNDTVKNAISSASLADELQNSTWIYGDYEPAATTSATGGIYANKLSEINATLHNTENQITVDAKIASTVLAGKFIEDKLDSEDKPIVHTNSNGETSLTIGEGFSTNADIIAGAYAAGDKEASGGKVYIAGDYDGIVYAGYSEGGKTSDNTAYISGGVNAASTTLLGTNKTDGTSGATLAVTGNGNTLQSIKRFDTITFDNVAFTGDAALSVTSADLTGTALEVASLAGGTQYHAGDKVALLDAADITGTSNDITLADDIVQAGIAQELTVSAEQEGNSINLTVTGVGLAPQTNLVAQTRAASAAFVNQGTDLISDSLDTISRDDNYGVKTFAAVHGNRSKYDVADDLKINGWSTIVGVGNADKFDNGSELSWGVFYENGSGNYRTYNSFNNEFFRGDGSMVYNGGGIAARYENKNGVYTEGSLRAGMLKNELDNAMRNVNGSYGYETESAYYGAHIGVGKIISLSDSSDLDIYGKFFHTYTEGDSVTIADDKFDFDSITSDRLRVGARITSNKENKFSTYYGLAYEYEFNGDADMTAQGIRAERQSFGGGSGIAELGFNYQPTPDSPWSFDLNMRGYVGERQGGSFNVQATYTF